MLNPKLPLTKAIQLAIFCLCTSTSVLAQGMGIITSGLDRQEIRAQLRPIQYTTLSAEIGAVVQSISLKEGDRFKAGQTLMKMMCDLHEAQRAKSAAELAGAERSLEANQRLVALNAAGLMELDLAKNTVDKAKAELQMSVTQLSKCEIKAPFDGVVAELRIREQQYVQPGSPVIDILDDSAFEIEFLAPSVWLSRLKVGKTIRVQMDEVQKTAQARITRVSPRIDPVSQSIKVNASVEGMIDSLKSGMSGRVIFQ